jgi:hypothetical protein
LDFFGRCFLFFFFFRNSLLDVSTTFGMTGSTVPFVFLEQFDPQTFGFVINKTMFFGETRDDHYIKRKISKELHFGDKKKGDSNMDTGDLYGLFDGLVNKTRRRKVVTRPSMERIGARGAEELTIGSLLDTHTV